MSVAFHKGQTLGPDDLKISVRDTSGTLIDPSSITYSIFDITTGVEVLIGSPNQTPASTEVGMFYVNATLPLDSNIGDWIVRWNFRETSISPIVQVVQEFNVVGDITVTTITEVPTEQLMVNRLRIVLRDNNPDRNYRFRPPSTEKFLQTQTEVFGYIWEEEELYEYLLMAVDDFNAAPPVTGVMLNNLPSRWRTVILLGAAAHAVRAVTMNWIADEFDYSISGVSLSLEKSSKYQGMKENFENEFDKLKEQAKRSIKIVKGLQQPRYGIGISSALGPFSRQGVQSRRNYVSSGGGWN
jgi:hypothetical protein